MLCELDNEVEPMKEGKNDSGSSRRKRKATASGREQEQGKMEEGEIGRAHV